MTDERLLLWLVGLSPILLMAGVIIASRWRKRAYGGIQRELIPLTISLAAVGALIYWDIRRTHGAISAHVHLQRPFFLLWIVPLLGLLLALQSWTLSGIARGRMWTAYLLRSAALILLLIAVAGLQMVVEQDTLTVVYALDVSKSVPLPERQKAIDFMKKTVEAKRPDDKVGLLVFGGKAEWEVTPSAIFTPPDAKNIKSSAMPDSTNIENALKKALNRSDEDARRRIVLFTDGRQTTGDVAEELKRQVSMGVDVWVVPLRRTKESETAEMLVEKIVLPSELLWEQPYDAHVFVRSNVHAKAKVTLYTGDKGGQSKFEQIVGLEPGKNRVTFPGLKMHSGGAKEVQAVIEPVDSADDTLTENNQAFAFTDVATENRVLIMTSDMVEVQQLLGALEGEKMTLDVRSGATIPENPEAFRAYDCIVLANLARGFLSEQQMKVIETCVREQGAGLVMIGGDQSFGAGGYLNTPIEEALPVNMDLDNKEIMPSGALCIVLHTCEFADGNAWGKKISKAAIKTLAPGQDYAGLIYYGNMGGEQWCFKPAPVRPQMYALIDNCDPGDMPSLDTIVSMAVKSLANLPNVSLKHCIVITDGDPSKPTGSTINAAKNGKITISTISISPHSGYDVSELKDVAAQTGGKYYATDDPSKLPQIFIKEAAVIRKSLIYSDEKGIPLTLGTPGVTLRDFGSKFPNVHSLVMTRPKVPLGELQLYTTVKGEKVPLLMSWNYGLGKGVAFTSDCTNRWSPEWVKWGSYRKFWAGLLTWASRQRIPTNHTVTTRIDGDTGFVTIEGLNSKGEYVNFANLTGSAIDPDVSRNGTDARTYDLNFRMTAPGRYEASFPVTKPGAYAITIVDQSDPKKPNTIITGLANSYSPEFLYLDADEAALANMGDIATGKNKVSRLKELGKLDPLKCGVFAHDMPPASQPTDLFWPLILAALCLFPLDVAVRRLALDPERAFVWLWLKVQPMLMLLRLKKKQLSDAAAEALAGKAAPPPPPPDIVPTGAQSREAQSRFEELGAKSEFDLSGKPAEGEQKPVVGGTKVSQPDDAASDYTRALLKAKKRAKKNE